ncbi:head-closure protein [Vibrio phage 1.265.O._10N.286.52.F6]|nr:head-closure protein [Vibrio phage 1.265.O._10N.286.52.F6]
MALDLKDTAKRLIRSLAGTAEMGLFYIKGEAGGVEDPNTGQWTPGTSFSTAIDGALVAYSERLVDGTNIRSGDKMLICAFDAPIQNNSVIEIYGNDWTVVNTNPINHAGQVQIYKLQVRSS